jgi:hypothetical protein
MADEAIWNVLHSVCMELEECQELISQWLTAAEPCNHSSVSDNNFMFRLLIY